MRRVRGGWPASAMALALVCASASAGAQWRSSLYPESWTPGFKDTQGRFLHDFSYAGYHAGADPIPSAPPGQVVDVTKAPYNADASGSADVTAILQKAIDDVSAAGGGIVFLPAGTYRIARPAGAEAALWIGTSSVVLRGAGPDKTFLFNDQPDMRQKQIILLRPKGSGYYSWSWEPSDVRTLTADAIAPTNAVTVGNVSGYSVGDWIVLENDLTAPWLNEHFMAGTWTSQDTPPLTFYRQITGIDAAAKTVTLDAPIRYDLLTRDNARIHRAKPHIEEVGVEELAIGNRQNDVPGTGTNDYDNPSTGAYQMHASFGVYFNHVVNGWLKNVRTYQPAQNSKPVHLLSSGVRMDFSRFITILGGNFSRPQYKGAGGNGYMYVLTGNDCLVVNSKGSEARHNFSFAFLHSSGNVVHASTAQDGQLPADFHQRLSPANLLDNVRMVRDSWEAVYRDCCSHGHSTTQTVFWNIEGQQYPVDQWPWDQFIIESNQLGWGYVIGTRGTASQVKLGTGNFNAQPVDFLEGAGQGDTLEPQSLFLDQRQRRLGIAGAAGVGGEAGAGGGAGAAGSAGSAGSGGAGSGGVAGSAGSVAGMGGSSGSASSANPDAEDTSGCGCRSGSSRSIPGSAALLLLTIGAAVRRRRRRILEARTADLG